MSASQASDNAGACAMRLVRALLWRFWKERGMWLVVRPAMSPIVLVLLASVVGVWPEVLTGTSRYALEVHAANYFRNLPRGWGIGMALVFAQGPWLIATLSAVKAAGIAQSIIADEGGRGGLELLCTTPMRPEDLFRSLMVVTIALAVLDWACMLATLSVVAGGWLVATGAYVQVAPSFAVNFLLPLPMVLWAALIALAASLRFPGLARVRAGGSGSVVQVVSVTPVLVVFLAISLRPRDSILMAGAVATVAAVCGSLLVALYLRKSFRPELLLEG